MPFRLFNLGAPTCRIVVALTASSLVSAAAVSQSVVRGRVTDSETGAPLENANIYFSSTTIGTTTGADGVYTLSGVPAGRLTLVGSLVGHSLESLPLTISPPETLRVDFHLRPLLLEGQGLEVVAPEPKEWKRLLELFTQSFLGASGNSTGCKILNPQVLELHMREGTDVLIASTDSVLRLENDALGYMLYIRMSLFEWDVSEDHGRYFCFPRFVEVIPRDDLELKECIERRKQAFVGSLRSFLSSLISGSTQQAGFSVRQGKLTALRSGMAETQRLVSMSLEPVERHALWKLAFKDWLRVDFREGGRNIRSYLALERDSVLVDANGNLLDPLNLDVAGDWTKNRIADLLPLDYIGEPHE